MRRRPVTCSIVAGLLGGAALAAGAAAPAVADGPMTTVVLGDRSMILADPENDVVALVNTTREHACPPEIVAFEAALFAWIQGGEVGDPPEFPGEPEGLEAVEFTVHELRSGNVVATSRTPVHVELWSFEEGKSAAQDLLFAFCFDTDGLLDGTSQPVGPAALLASGNGTWTTHDNDWSGMGPRANPWSDRVTAELSGEIGDAVYTVDVKNHVVRGDYHRGKFDFSLRLR